MKHVITTTDVPNDDYKLKVGDLVEFTDRYNNKHNMIVMPERPCRKCCLVDQKSGGDLRIHICSVLNGQYSICYNGRNSEGEAKFVTFT